MNKHFVIQVLIGAMVAGEAFAQEVATTNSAQPIQSDQLQSNPLQSDQAKSIAELQRALGVRDQVIRNLIQRIEQLERAMAQMQGTPSPPQTNVAPRSSESVNSAATTATPNQSQDVEHMRAAFERTLIDRGGLTLPKWTWEFDTGVSYSHSSSETLTIDGFTVYPVVIVGDIVSERVRRDTMGLSFTTRVGLPWQTQFDLRVPYSYENSSRVSAASEEHTLSDHGLGDIELGFSRPLWHKRDGSIDVLGALRWKTTTGRDPFSIAADEVPFGTGFNAVSFSATAVTAQDPMVFYGTLSYTNNFYAHKNGASINPGDGFGLQLGTAIAMNLDTSLSFGYQQQFSNRTHVNGAPIAGSYVNTGSLSIGVSRALASGRAVDTTLVVGLNEDSPDIQLNISMPIRKSR